MKALALIGTLCGIMLFWFAGFAVAAFVIGDPSLSRVILWSVIVGAFHFLIVCIRRSSRDSSSENDDSRFVI